LSFLSKCAAWAAHVLLPLGGLGLFVAAAVDSSFVPLPEGVDLWLISLSVLRPARMPYYTALATLGSVLGCCALYAATRWSERKFLESNPKYKGLPRVQRWVEKYEFWTLLIAAILPPPTPFKLVVIATGLVGGHFGRFLLALLIGRTLRYAGEAVLAVRYGKQVWQGLLHFGPYILGLAVAAFLIVYLVRRLRVERTRA
jgi:membrane protein YqaA with SNARE-associated domain